MCDGPGKCLAHAGCTMEMREDAIGALKLIGSATPVMDVTAFHHRLTVGGSVVAQESVNHLLPATGEDAMHT